MVPCAANCIYFMIACISSKNMMHVDENGFLSAMLKLAFVCLMILLMADY